MRVDCLVENIEKYSPLLARIIPSHAQIPVFSNILIEAKKEGLFLCVTDLEIGARVMVPAKIDEEGATTVSAKHFLEIISSLPKDKVVINTEGDSLLINSKGNKITLQTIPREEFPDLFNKKGDKKISFKQGEFKEIFSKLIFSVSQDESRPVLTGVLLFQKEKGTDFVSTDGYRLSYESIDKKIFPNESEKIILSSSMINEILMFKNEDEEISLSILKDANQVMVESREIMLIGRLIEGEFPSYERVIPSSYKTRIIINKDAFVQSVRLSSIFARESANIIKLKIEDGTLKLSSKASGVGEGETKIEVEQEGENNEISFNVKFVLDYIKNVNVKEIAFEMSNALESGVFKPVNGNDYLHVIMPVRVQE